MHLLAHALLAYSTLPPDGDTDAFLTGSLMADFFTGEDLDGYPAAMQLAIRQHQDLDTWTDCNPEFVALRRQIMRFGAPRFTAGILADIFWGCSLAREWQELARPLCGLDLPEFSLRVTKALDSTAAHHSPAFAHAVPWITGHRWLQRMESRDGVLQSLQGLSYRLTGADELPRAIAFLDTQYAKIQTSLKRSWPAAVARARGFARANL
ncbi:ACP phosphodiesterase [Spirochaeta africana]|uniref:DUF479 domain-containing protein n=1 Tax=Spirochaeta africana (strain ATCC 700263 / DSM 8902 / Z-7692) TaxID=889378 RepID=H9UJH2_SPIAZ|nr:ACP phosphodiesterase [Spirochaeta africana]AFG37665.1 hypothetical protein Spiaf_1607 [Spirochaeta africana DSM 8902]